jgi:hypothetical protein
MERNLNGIFVNKYSKIFVEWEIKNIMILVFALLQIFVMFTQIFKYLSFLSFELFDK